MTNEEHVTAIQAGQDRQEHQAELCKNNRAFIAKIANSLKGYAEFDDLLQEGYIAILTAADRYDPGAGRMFISYAADWIRAAMLRFIRSNGGNIRLPEYLRERVRMYHKIVSDWERKHGHQPPDSVLCLRLGINRDNLDKIKAAAITANTVSIATKISEDITLSDMIEDQHDYIGDVLEKLQREQRNTAIWHEVETLSSDQSRIIKARYQDGRTLQECSSMFRISLSRAAQIEQTGIRELKRPKHKKRLLPFYEDIRSHAMQGTGTQTFARTWTSATERTALYDLGEQ